MLCVLSTFSSLLKISFFVEFQVDNFAWQKKKRFVLYKVVRFTIFFSIAVKLSLLLKFVPVWTQQTESLPENNHKVLLFFCKPFKVYLNSFVWIWIRKVYLNSFFWIWIPSVYQKWISLVENKFSKSNSVLTNQSEV